MAINIIKNIYKLKPVSLLISAFISLAPILVNAQISEFSYKSKHSYDLSYHKTILEIEKDINNIKPIIPLNKNSERSLSSSVFGYLPYWEYPSAVSTLHFDLLSHISVFDFHANADGSIDNPPGWPWTDLINKSHENGVKVIATIVNFNSSEIHTLLTNDNAKTTLFGNILTIIQQYYLDGVNIDFENINTSDRGMILVSFMGELTAYIHNINPSYEISFASPPVNWGGWDFAGLANSCDYLFIMGYNFWGGWSITSGPCSPLTGGNYNIMKVLSEEYSDIVSDTPDKLILGVPYYGNSWITEDNTAYSAVIDHLRQPKYKSAIVQAEQDSMCWDLISNTSWSVDNNTIKQIWFDSDSSLSLKYQLAIENQLKGVGMWALGYDGNRPELWQALRDNFGTTEINDEVIPTDVCNITVYPNPATQDLNVRIMNIIEIPDVISIKDPSGRNIDFNITNIDKTGDDLTIKLSMKNHKPGLYFLSLNFTDKSTFRNIIKKLILY